MAARLIVSVTADDTADLLSFADSVADRGVPLSLLVRPVGSQGPLEPTSRLAGWLRERHTGGDALVLHGYDHSRRPLGPQGRIRRTEFSALPAHEAALRLAAAKWVMERAGLATACAATISTGPSAASRYSPPLISRSATERRARPTRQSQRPRSRPDTAWRTPCGLSHIGGGRHSLHSRCDGPTGCVMARPACDAPAQPTRELAAYERLAGVDWT